jgi:hypothetical protein
MAKTVKFPNFDLGETASESLLNFYSALGWDRNCNLDVRKVKINREQSLELCGMLTELEEDKSAANLMYLNYGPAWDDDIPYNKVRLQEGWLK